MSIYVDTEEKNIIVVASLDAMGTQAVDSTMRALRTSRWESHKQIAERLQTAVDTTESGAVEMTLNESAAKRIEDSIHYARMKRNGSIAEGARRLQNDLAAHLGLDPNRPLRSGA